MHIMHRLLPVINFLHQRMPHPPGHKFIDPITVRFAEDMPVVSWCPYRLRQSDNEPNKGPFIIARNEES